MSGGPPATNQDLIKAASDGNVEQVSLLLQTEGIDPNCQEPNLFTPINCAVWNNRIEVVRVLLADPRVDPNKPARIGETPLICAIQKRYEDLIRILLSNPRVNINQRKNDGGTAFLHAAQDGYETGMRILLEHPGLDVDVPLKVGGATPLFLACSNGHLGAVKLILASGKNKFIAGVKWVGKTPAQYIRDKGHDQVADLLEAYTRNPAMVMWDLRSERGDPEALASEFLAAAVFLSDDLVRVTEHYDDQFTVSEILGFGSEDATTRAVRFFRIMVRLPLELQMIMVNRVHGLTEDLVGSDARESAFRRLVARLGPVQVPEGGEAADVDQ